MTKPEDITAKADISEAIHSEMKEYDNIHRQKSESKSTIKLPGSKRKMQLINQKDLFNNIKSKWEEELKRIKE